MAQTTQIHQLTAPRVAQPSCYSECCHLVGIHMQLCSFLEVLGTSASQLLQVPVKFSSWWLPDGSSPFLAGSWPRWLPASRDCPQSLPSIPPSPSQPQVWLLTCFLPLTSHTQRGKCSAFEGLLGLHESDLGHFSFVVCYI